MHFKYLIIFSLILFIISSCSVSSKNAENAAMAESVRNLGEAYIAAGNPTLALRELLKADSLVPNDPYTNNDLGLAYLSRGIPEKAIYHFKKAIEIKPEYAPAINNLGTAYIAQADWDSAIETLVPLTQNILYATPHFAEANLAYAYLNKNEYLKAERHYKASLDLSPNYVTALRGLSVLYRIKGEFDKSLPMIEKAIRFAPKNGELYLQKGKTLELAGKRELAKNAYLKAISIGTDDVVEEAEMAVKNF
jgi:tetratricopeptide (TPR) repeat protein